MSTISITDINLVYKTLGYKINTTILKNGVQKALDAIVVKTNQLLSKTEQYYILFFTIPDVIDATSKLNCNLDLKSLSFAEPFREYMGILCPSYIFCYISLFYPL